MKRKLSELAAEALRDIEDDKDGEDGSSGVKNKAKTNDKKDGPHDQFGRNVHAMVRFASKVAEELGDKSK